MVDIAGAKALKERLGERGADEAPPASAADVPQDAPPVYHWFGVAHNPPQDAEDDGAAAAGASLFSRLGFSFR
jgi:hypothetical protein